MKVYTRRPQKSLHKRNFLAITAILLILAGSVIAWGLYEYTSWKQGKLPITSTAVLEPAADILGATACTDLPAQGYWSSIDGDQTWFLKGDQFTPAEKTLKIVAVVSPDTTIDENATYGYHILNSDVRGKLEPIGDNRYTARIDTDQLDPGEYTIVASAENICSQTQSAGYSFNVSYPLYVTWTFDWEGNDVQQTYLNDIDNLANKYEFPLTHFFNPRIYATNAISDSRADYLTQWVIDRRESRGDSIQLHIHMYYDMVEAAGVTPQTSPAWGWNTNDGYDVLVSGYSYNDIDTILDWAIVEFEKNNLGKPDMFRAGGWYANETTLLALEDNGFVADSSGRTNFTFGRNNAVSPWYLDITTQPYHPNRNDQNSSTGNTLDLWEFPNNGGDSWAFTKDEMYTRYQANYNGGTLSEKRVVTYLSHPDWFYEDAPKMDGLLADIGEDLYKNDTGPVIFATLDEVYNIWSNE